MSSENHGVPEEDDPFAYLYRGEGGDGAPAQETAPLPGVPRTSYHQATQVGRTQYGQQQQQAPQGYQPQPQLPHQSSSAEQPTAQYQAPQYQQSPQSAPQQTPPGGGRAGARTAGGGSRSGGRGVMFGTIAVVAALAIGIGIAISSSGSDKSPNAGAGGTPAASSAGPSASTSSTPSAAPTSGTVPPADAATMTLSGGAAQNTNHKGALGAGGTFVDGMTTPGATITWTVTAPAPGDYYLWVRYANATGKPASAAVTVNQKPALNPIGLKDYGSKGSWDSWFSSYVTVSLKQGPNTVALSCAPGASCTFNVDQIALTPPTGSGSRPASWK